MATSLMVIDGKELVPKTQSQQLQQFVRVDFTVTEVTELHAPQVRGVTTESVPLTETLVLQAIIAPRM